MTSPIAKVRRERGSSVYAMLRNMAIAYQFKPGERLSEIELAERLGVSRTPVREALTRLVTEGFLQTATRGYTSLQWWALAGPVQDACARPTTTRIRMPIPGCT